MLFRSKLTGRALGLVTPSPAGFAVEDDSKYLVNPGSVGQPRDADPRAAYAIVDADSQTMEMYRVEYPVQLTQSKMVAAGLPEPLVRRLAMGR